jgi:transmembrane sensor
LTELHAWLRIDDSNVHYFNELNALFQEERMLATFSEEKLKSSWQKLESRIESEEISTRKPIVISLLQSTYFRVAASVCLAAFVVWSLLPQPSENQMISKTSLITNATERNVAHLLPDSTQVWLNANSSLEYGADFLQTRHVTLKGEAFFDVKKKQQQNFVVETSSISIEVKGTRFNVQAYDADNEKATLEEGQIELKINGQQETYAMTPGDQITIDKKKQTIVREKVDPKNFTAWKEPQLIFDNTPLAEIIAKLENRFNVKISIDDSLAQRERLSMTIDNESLEEILEMIHLSSALNYKTENATIVIYE